MIDPAALVVLLLLAGCLVRPRERPPVSTAKIDHDLDHALHRMDDDGGPPPCVVAQRREFPRESPAGATGRFGQAVTCCPAPPKGRANRPDPMDNRPRYPGRPGVR